MNREIGIAICAIAREHGMVYDKDKRMFIDTDGNKYSPTQFGLCHTINHNYRQLYLSTMRDSERLRVDIKRLTEENIRLKQDMVHKKSRMVLLNILDSDTPERVIERIKKYLQL